MVKNNISVVVFDLGKVLIPFDYKKSIDKLELIEKDLGKKFYEFYQNNYQTHRKFERGDLPEEEFISIMLNALEHKVSKEIFIQYYSDIFTLNENVASLLPLLKKNYTLCLLSNTDSLHHKYGWYKYDFLKYFDKLFLSYQVGAVKPEEKIYRAVEEFTKKPSSEHIFIDDIPEYAEAARRFGWNAIQFQNYDQLVKALEENNIVL
ncbi:MAG: HAD family phosphatase [Ignavibacteriales bacterium]|nr:MAG: HAD family phosphatase [Ignavibacteriales bacterium]